ncbi:hypothetical protein IQ227_03825 [Anabaena aphanizomenioides LEGE 00250]|uniref:CopG family transcriptional regulator n=1 Tax=Sphaerospermopsis aphanizomenoides LEGE 00250 TaxID=2777972 RepID=A0ABR9V9N0_9CYAN|nr:hypothetical protein [Sphaerospermopsis aphanizomenoides]MBE9235191.1 hypothetical protein [Sphaerospermopsis aphanizomenoides LEGE 00250]
MPDILTITITPELKAAFLELAQAECISVDSLVVKAIESYILTHKFRAIYPRLFKRISN